MVSIQYYTKIESSSKITWELSQPEIIEIIDRKQVIKTKLQFTKKKNLKKSSLKHVHSYILK